MTVTIRDEAAGDRAAIQDLLRRAFGGEDEARLVDALWRGGYVRASLVAEDAGRIVGHILFSALPILTPEGPVPALALAPMAVVPDRQRQGIGTRLVRQGLQTCAAGGSRVVIVLGHPAFYARFGFSSRLTERLKAPYSGEAFMALELVPGALEGVTGTVCYPPPFGT